MHFLKSLLHEEYHTRYSFELCLLHLTLRLGTPLAVQWLRLCASSAGGAGLIPVQGTKIPHATESNQKITKKKRKQQKRQNALDSILHQLSSFFLIQDYCSVVWTCHSLFNHSSIYGQLGCFQHCEITMLQWITMFSMHFQSAGGVSSRPILMRETAKFKRSCPGLLGTAKFDSTSSVWQCLSLSTALSTDCAVIL